MSRKIGLGTAVRNSSGVLLLAAIFSFNFIYDVEVAEAKAICEGIYLALSKGLKPLCVKSDSFNVVSMCNSISTVKCDVGNIVQNIRDVVALNNARAISFIPRSGNLVAHGLAKWALMWNSPTVWVRNFHRWLASLGESDVIGVPSC
ncbi:hypothetical protein ACOSQ3_024053 [Xanthoceras sorbifolium]